MPLVFVSGLHVGAVKFESHNEAYNVVYRIRAEVEQRLVVEVGSI